MKKNVLVLTLLATAVFAWSFMPKGADKGWAEPFIEPDSVFVKVAASSNMLEVELGNMAQQKATNQRIRDFGATMVAEHTKALQELTALARSKNFTMPTEMMRQHRRQVDFLRDVSGAEFDQMYMRVMVEEHREDVDEFEDASKKAADADLRAWAGRMLPHLQTHLDSARSLRSYVRNNYNYMNTGAATGATTHATHDNVVDTAATATGQGNAGTLNTTTGTTSNQNAKSGNASNKKDHKKNTNKNNRQGGGNQ